MTHGELVENLGTIAHSGTRAFLKQLAGEPAPDAKLIGHSAWASIPHSWWRKR
jgi:molecular chaperone HtpG